MKFYKSISFRDVVCSAFYVAAMVSVSNYAIAADSICPPSALVMPPVSRQVDLIELTSDKAKSTGFKQFQFGGNVRLLYQSQLIQAEEVNYDQESAMVHANGAIRYQQNGLFLAGDSAQFELGSKSGQVTGATYFFQDQHVTGFAQQIEFDQKHARLTDASFSTCIETPRVWELRASDLRLDVTQNEGTARNVSLRLYTVPVAYLPYISFPLGKRKSGFLTPRFGNNTQSGISAAMPYYLNIAPNVDATITPVVMSKRGALAQNELRYLTQTDRGAIHVDVIPQDRAQSRTRGAFAYSHRGSAGRNIAYVADINRVTDNDYLREFGGSLDTVSMSYVPSETKIGWYDTNWTASLLAHDYQLITSDFQPAYRRLPQIDFLYASPRKWIRWAANGEYTYFDHTQGKVGHRAWLEPDVSFPLEFSAFEFVPDLRWRQIEYAVAPQHGQSLERHSIGNYAWNASAKVFFERESERSLQRLTPLIGHHYSPYVDQSALPIFDTSVSDWRISQLLDTRRYDGNDRMGDAHFVSAGANWSKYNALTMRSQTNLTLIHAYYLADQLSQLPGESTAKKQDMVTAGQFDTYLSPRFSINGRLMYDWRTKIAEKGIMQVHFDTDDLGLNLSYRFRQPEIEQVSLAGFFDLQGRWRLNARSSYSVLERRVQESAIGTEYNSCCFSIRLIAQYYVDPTSGLGNTSYGAQIELRGLASFGESSAGEFSQEFVNRRYRYDVF